MQFERVPGDQLLVRWDDVPQPERMVFIDVWEANEDDVPISLRCLGLHGSATIEADQVVEWGSNIFARAELS